MNGRRALRAELEARYTWVQIEPSPMLTAAMARRRLRREFARELERPFRPVYGYRGVPAPDHKDVIAAMRNKKREVE